MKKIAILTSVFLAVLCLAFGCVTHKKKSKKDDVGWFKKGYHGMTTHYNYWFNADELFNQSIDRLEDSHQDNYNQLLPLYPFKAADPKSVSNDMDEIVKKSSKAIALHRIGEWTDDCYILIGQAQYVKQDYETAESTFAFIKEEYNPNRPKVKKSKKKVKKKKKKKKKRKKKKRKKKKRKKKKKKKKAKKKKSKKSKKKSKEERTKEAEANKAAAEAKKREEERKAKAKLGANPYKDGAFDRFSAYPASMIWYARTLTDREKYDEADYLIQELKEDNFFPEKLRDELALAKTYNLLQQKQYAAAIPHLEQAVATTKKRNGKARMAYILAQLYEMAGNSEGSYQALNTVLKSRPSFTMGFNARLMRIKSGWLNGTIASAEAERSLNKLNKEDKYEEFRDQIYFTLATIALKEDRKKDAITALKKSLVYNKTNASQKAESYITLADLYFETEDFVQAKSYYDSTLIVLNAKDERHKRVKKYADNLTDIARLITTINTNDSLVAVYNMSDDERRDLAKSIKKKQEEEAAKAAAVAEAKTSSPTGINPGFKAAGVAPSSFYFYNSAFVKKGSREFDKVWGDRKLGDNWRRKDKLASLAFDDPAVADSIAVATISDEELDDIFKGIPQSEAELAVIYGSTYKSMFELGKLFRDKLENNRRTVITHEDELSRFADSTRYQKETWYYLYLAHRDQSHTAEAQKYYDLLVNGYPNSSHARAISDENFLNATKEKERKLNAYYKATFDAFSNADYQAAFKRCQSAPGMFGGTNPLMPKFALLSALCTGNLQGQEEYCKSLKTVIGNYPDSPEAVRAREIARLLGCDGFKQAAQTQTSSGQAAVDFTLADEKIHYFLVVLHGKDVPVSKVKAAISDFNRKNYQLAGLRLSNIYLGTDTATPIMVIRKFDNKKKAMKYYQDVFNKRAYLGNDPQEWEAEYYPITQDNYRKVLKNRSLSGYQDFFQSNYFD